MLFYESTKVFWLQVLVLISEHGPKLALSNNTVLIKASGVRSQLWLRLAKKNIVMRQLQILELVVTRKCCVMRRRQRVE